MSYDGNNQFINIITPPPPKKKRKEKKMIYIYSETINTQLKTFISYSMIESLAVSTYFLYCHV